jgi:hypothetical protein
MFVTAVAVSDAVCQSPPPPTDAGGAAGAGAALAAYGKIRGIETFDAGFTTWLCTRPAQLPEM